MINAPRIRINTSRIDNRTAMISQTVEVASKIEISWDSKLNSMDYAQKTRDIIQKKRVLTIWLDDINIVNGLKNVTVFCVDCSGALNDSHAYLLGYVGGIIVFLLVFDVRGKSQNLILLTIVTTTAPILLEQQLILTFWPVAYVFNTSKYLSAAQTSVECTP